jgi:hypothetical protein
LGHGHGKPQTQNTRRLRHLPQPDPYRAASRTAHAVVTGEPDDRETIKSGSAGGRAEKDQPSWLAPRRAADPSSWLTGHRRLARDYETLPERSETFIYWAMIGTMARRIDRGHPATRPGPRPLQKVS